MAMVKIIDESPEESEVRQWWLCSVRSVPSPEPTVLLVGQYAFLALVADHPNTLAKLFRYDVLESALPKQGVNGLQLAPALLPGYLGEVGGRLEPRVSSELYLDTVDPNL